ncbi:MAG: metallophosphoesterase family protein [Ruminococcus sp.]|nr:metallophosphoesterase family protein [Candidatus Copronaster equi]
MKKILSIILSIVLTVLCTITGFASESKNQLKFDENGKFKILILADIQDGYPMEKDLIAFINEALDKSQPDLVVFLGDNVMGPNTEERTEEDYLKGFDEALTPLTQRGIPFTLVFGNHDDETMPTYTKEQTLAKYMKYDGCLAYDAVESLHGCGTHNIEILSSDSSHTAFNLWLMDSGDYVFDEQGNKLHYDCVRKDQIEWYENTSKALEEKNGAPVPSFMFQHIVPADVAQQVMVTLPFHIGDLAHYDMEDGTAVTYLPNIFGFQSGIVGEGLCPSTENDGQWDAIVKRGDVLATFFGHDHKNTYKANVKGVDAINVPGCTFHAYHSNIHSGAVEITLDEKDLSTYEMNTIYTCQLALEKNSELPNLSRTKAQYAFSNFLRILLKVTLTPFKKIANVFGSIIY